MMGRRLSVKSVRSVLAVCVVLSPLCGCGTNRPTPMYSRVATAGATLPILGGTGIGAGVGAAAIFDGEYVRVARAVLYSDDDDGGPFAVFSYLIAAQKDPQSPVGQRLREAIAAYAREAPYCASNQIDPQRVNIFVVPTTPTRPPDVSRTLCADESSVRELLFVDYDTARASRMADKAGLQGQGPYLIASLKPLSTLSLSDRSTLLIWDLSAIEPRLIRLAVDLFIDTADRPSALNKISLRQWAFELRNWIAVAAQGWNLSTEAAAAVAANVKGPN